MSANTELLDLIGRCRNSVSLDMLAHQHLANSQRLPAVTRSIHAQEEQKLHDILLKIDEVLEVRL